MVKGTFFFCHYYIAWELSNAGEAREQSWNESLKSRWIPGGSCGYTSGTKRKHFAVLSSPRPCWRWLQLQPCSPQWATYWLEAQIHRKCALRCCSRVNSLADPSLWCHSCTIEVWEWIINFISLFNSLCDYLYMLGLKLNHFSYSGPMGLGVILIGLLLPSWWQHSICISFFLMCRNVFSSVWVYFKRYVHINFVVTGSSSDNHDDKLWCRQWQCMSNQLR